MKLIYCIPVLSNDIIQSMISADVIVEEEEEEEETEIHKSKQTVVKQGLNY